MKKSLRTGLPLILNQIVCEGSAFARNLILARLLGPEEMGQAVALALIMRLIEMMGDFSWDRLLVQAGQSDLPALRGSVHSLQLLKGVGQTVLSALFAFPILAWIYPDIAIASLVLIALSFLIRGAMHWDFRERQRENKFAPALVVEGGSNLIAVVVVSPIAWLLRDHSALAWAMLVQAFAAVLLSHAVATTAYTIRFDRSAVRRCMRYGIPVAANALLMFVALQGDRFIISVNYTAAELAAFALAAQLTVLPALIGARVTLALKLPEFSRLLVSQSTLAKQFSKDAGLVAVSAVALVVFFGVFGGVIIETLYGAAYASTSICIWLLALTAGLRFARALPSTLIIATEKTSRLIYTNAPRLFTLPLAVWLAAANEPLFIIVGLGACSEAISLGIAAILARRELNGSCGAPAIHSYQGAI